MKLFILMKEKLLKKYLSQLTVNSAQLTVMEQILSGFEKIVYKKCQGIFINIIFQFPKEIVPQLLTLNC